MNKASKVDLNRYKEFVASVTSNESNDVEFFINRVKSLHQQGVANIPLLMTAGIGLASEGGEFDEIVKKVLFQGKPLDEDTKYHLYRELGDIAWYWVNACRALNLDPNDVIRENVNKLINRYPAGQFDVHYSENRQDGDL
jgi:NTP pyrophosphatase (non-canonical NTP hydrolase)